MQIPTASILCLLASTLVAVGVPVALAIFGKVRYRIALKPVVTGALCFVATHDVELTGALADVCDNYHFQEVVQSGAVAFDYLLRGGPARGRSAIRLLGEMGFPPAVVAEARRLAPPPLS